MSPVHRWGAIVRTVRGRVELAPRAALAVTFALTALACGGGDDAASTDEVSSTSTTASSKASSTTAADGASTSTPGAGSDGGTTTTSNTGGGPTNGGNAGTGDDDSGYQRAAQGTYTFRVDGSFTFGTTKQSLPPTARLTVENLNATDQRHTLSSDDSETVSVFRLAATALRLVSLSTTQSGVAKEFRPDPPVAFAPIPLAVGDTWQWTITSTDGKTKVHQSSKVLRTERRTIGGTAVDTFVVQTTVTISGDLNATTNQTSWVSPAHGIQVRTEQTTKGSFGTLTFTSSSTSELTSLQPS
jgi:hypothetical protein